MPTPAPLFGLRDRAVAWMMRPRLPVQGIVTLDRRHVYIVPAGLSLIFIFLIVAMLLAGLNYNLNLGLILTFMLVGVGFAAMWLTFRNLLNVQLSVQAALPIYVHDLAYFNLQLTHPDVAPRIGFNVRYGADEVNIDQIPAEFLAVLPLRGTQRGWLLLPRLRILTRFPLGLFRAWSYADLEAATLVYPAPEPMPPHLPLGAQTAAGEHIENPAAESLDLLRTYRPGDALHTIAWKQSARQDTLISRTGLEATPQECWLDWHALPSHLDVETKLSRLSAWVLMAMQTEVRFGLRLPGLEIPLDFGAGHQARVLTALALYGLPATPQDAIAAENKRLRRRK